MKREDSPYDPYKRKARGKEISRFPVRGIRPSRAHTRVGRAVAQAVENALIAFKGTRGPKNSDEALWASIAWRIGPELFETAIRDKLSEDRCDGAPEDPRAAFQAFLNKNFPKPEGGVK